MGLASNELEYGGTGAATGAMIGGPWGAAIGGGAGLGLGLAKYFLADKPAEAKKRALAAATEAYSPWTGLHGDNPDIGNPFNDALGGAAAGAGMVQNINRNQSDQDLQKAQMDYLKSRSLQSPGTSTGVSQPGVMPLPSSPLGDELVAGSNTWANMGRYPAYY